MISIAGKLDNLVSIDRVYSKLIENKYSVGIFKMPNSSKIVVLADEFPNTIDSTPIDLEQLKGFLVVPFETNQQFPSFLIKPSFTAVFSCLENGEIVSENDFDDDFIKSIDEQEKSNTNRKPIVVQKAQETTSFQSKVALAVESIENGELKKVVLARTKEVELPETFNLIAFYLRLCQSYTNSFVSLVDSPISGTWMGATPELLVSLDAQNTFRTVALAGTKPIMEKCSPSETLWSEKEIEEQALVSRYIIECFKKIRLREYEEIGPKTVKAGNLLHLKTEFSVKLDEVNYENLSSLMLDLLHPTSAVCGTPKAAALAAIHQLETDSRAYYSGFLGPVNLNSGLNSNETITSLFVNLRCMNVGSNAAVLYAGAGITQDSNPENEFLETENKFLTLLSKLQS